MSTPDPKSFITGRLGRTLQGPVTEVADRRPIDPSPWLPLIESMATAPNAGGVLGAAYVDSLSRALGRQNAMVHSIDMNDLDAKVQQLG